MKRYLGVVVLLHCCAGICLLWGLRQPSSIAGLAAVAYVLGMRHAFDADHIAAIDNIVRKLAANRHNANGVGLYFSLGHSTVVCVMTLATALSVDWAVQNMPWLQSVGSVIGTAVSGCFLVLIGIVNLGMFLRMAKGLRRRSRASATPVPTAAPRVGGPLFRLFAPLLRLVSRSWHVYPVGFLFGLGFDTASEVALLAISATAVHHHTSVLTVLSLPLSFAAGMSLLDTVDGIFMVYAYRWALVQPQRTLYYNLSVTGVAVVAALGIGVVELVQVAVNQLQLRGTFWQWLSSAPLGPIGFMLAGIFVGVWLASYAWRSRRPQQTQLS